MNLPMMPAPVVPGGGDDDAKVPDTLERRKRNKQFPSVAEKELDGVAMPKCAIHGFDDYDWNYPRHSGGIPGKKRPRPVPGDDSPFVSLRSSPIVHRKRPEDPSTPITVTTSTTLSSTLEDTDPNVAAYSDTPWVDPLSSSSFLWQLEQEWATVHCLDEEEESRMQVEFVERTTQEMQAIVQYWYHDAPKPENSDDRLKLNTLWSLYQNDNDATENIESLSCKGESHYSNSIEELFQSIAPLKLHSLREEEAEECLSLELVHELYNDESMRRWQILQMLQPSSEHWNGPNVRRRCYNVLAMVLCFFVMLIASKFLELLHSMYVSLISFALDVIPPDSIEVLLALLVVLIV